MKRMALLLVLLVFTAFRAGAEGEPAFAFGGRLAVARCEEYVTMRAEPGKKGKVIAKLPLGENAYFTGEQTEDYTRVYTKTGEGWVLTEYLDSAPWEEGETLTLDAATTIRMNLFLTAFTGTGLSRFRLGWTDGAELLDCAILRRVLMEPLSHQEGEWPEGDRRVEASEIYADARRYFGLDLRKTASPRYPLREGRFYWRTEETPALSGFAVLKSAERLREDVLFVRLGVFGIGMPFAPEGVCMFDERGARSAYPKAAETEAIALVRTGADWTDESAWRLAMFLRREQNPAETQEET